VLIAGDAIDRREHPLLDLRIEHTFLFHIPLLPGGLITTVTLAELSVGPLVARDQQERSARQAHLQQAEAELRTPGVRRGCGTSIWSRGSIAARRQATVRTWRGAYDAMIAATAIANDLPVYTCNPADFGGIEELDVVAVPAPHPR